MASRSNAYLRRSESKTYLFSQGAPTLPHMASYSHDGRRHYRHPAHYQTLPHFGGVSHGNHQRRSNVYTLLNGEDDYQPSPCVSDEDSDEEDSFSSRSVSLPPIASITNHHPSPAASHQKYGLKPVHWPESRPETSFTTFPTRFHYNGVPADHHAATVLGRINSSESLARHTSPRLSPLKDGPDRIQTFPSPAASEVYIRGPSPPPEYEYASSASTSSRAHSAPTAPYSPALSSTSVPTRSTSYQKVDAEEDEEDVEWRNYISGTIQHAVCTWPIYKDGCSVPVACGFHSKKHTTKRHIETVHLKIQRWQCTVCNKRFTQKASLNRHQLLHTGEKPFKCNYKPCPAAFNDRARKHRHMIEYHDHKPKHHIKQKPHTLKSAHRSSKDTLV